MRKEGICWPIFPPKRGFPAGPLGPNPLSASDRRTRGEPEFSSPAVFAVPRRSSS